MVHVIGHLKWTPVDEEGVASIWRGTIGGQNLFTMIEVGGRYQLRTVLPGFRVEIVDSPEDGQELAEQTINMFLGAIGARWIA